jgi:GT2 family glycosyltransferase
MISIIYCTREPNPQHVNHIKDTSGLKNKIEVIEIINNGESLTKSYNRGLKMVNNRIVVFCHDDIIFEKNGWARKLLENFKNSDYGIIGIAGTTNLHESGRWWADPTKMVGSVKHRNNGKTWESKYSGKFKNKIIETIIVDGLFFAIDKDKIKEEFDESVKGFHFYEIDFCFRNHLKGVKIGVTFDVKVIHKSIGQTNDEWDKNREFFIEKYKEELPKNINSKPIVDDTFYVIKKEPKVKILISSNGDRRKVVKICDTIKKMGYDNYEIKIILSVDAKDNLEDVNIDNVIVVEGVYPSLHKNISILKWDDEIISEEDELFLFLSDDIILETNILNKFIHIYNKNSKSFGGIFPMVLNQDNTIFSYGIELYGVNSEDKKLKIECNLKGANSFYNYNYGHHKQKLGNIGPCFMTTKDNLEKHDWFRLDFENLFYESYFSIKCSLDKKIIYVDNDSLVKLDYNFLENEEVKNNINKDLNQLIKSLNEDKKTQEFIKIIKPQLQPQT